MAPHSNRGGDRSARVKRRRRFIRYRTELPLCVQDPLERDFDGRCDVISEGGLGGTVLFPLPLGSVVHLRFAIPTSPTRFDVLAIVRDQRDFEHGFEFVSLTDAERVAIRQFCNGLRADSETGQVDP